VPAKVAVDSRQRPLAGTIDIRNRTFVAATPSMEIAKWQDRNLPSSIAGRNRVLPGGGRSIVKPLISPHCEHYRATRVLHEVLLNTVREVTGKEVAFIQWNGTGPAKGSTA